MQGRASHIWNGTFTQQKKIFKHINFKLCICDLRRLARVFEVADSCPRASVCSLNKFWVSQTPYKQWIHKCTGKFQRSVEELWLTPFPSKTSVFSRGKNHPKPSRDWNHPEMITFSVLHPLNIIIKRSWSLYVDVTSQFWEISIYVHLSIDFQPNSWSEC